MLIMLTDGRNLNCFSNQFIEIDAVVLCMLKILQS